jgi:tyrosinase
VHGLGGWGDPQNDYRVPDGAFSSFHLSYPSPHTVRRNFTLRPYLNFPDLSFITDPLLEANATFTKAEIQKLTNGFVGDFKGFQTYFEAFNVCFCSISIYPWLYMNRIQGIAWGSAFQRGRVIIDALCPLAIPHGI